MRYQDLVDDLSTNIDVNDVCERFYEKVRKFLPDKIFKYYSLNNDSNLNDSKLKSLREGKVYVSSREKFNDPYDDYGYIYNHKSVSTYAEKLGIQWLLNDIYPDFKAISCFTKSGNDNFAMWAHYANNHQGYCIEYDLKKNFELCSMVLPVEYVDKKIYLTEMIKGRLEFVKQNSDAKLLEDALKFCTIFLSCVKQKTWNYEEEIRLVCSKDIPSKSYFNAMPNKIYIGSKCREEYANSLLQIGRSLNIDVYMMKVIRDKLDYELDNELLYKMNV